MPSAAVRLRSTIVFSLQRQDTAAAAAVLGELLENPKLRKQAEAALRRMRTPAAKKFLDASVPKESEDGK